MGTTISVSADDEGGVGEAQRWFEHVESIASRFQPASELSRLNDDTRSRVPLSPLLAEVFGVADRMRDLTHGFVDIAVGADVIRWGYDHTFEEVGDLAAPSPIDRADLVWSVDDGEVLRGSGVRFDLGGIAKGWAADRIVERGVARIVSAGGDVASSHPDAEVDVLGADNEVVACIGLGARGLATSSTLRRRWKAGEVAASHLIDPRSGDPVVSPVVSATAVAARAVEAEAAAKAILIRGADGLAWAAAQPWIDGAVVVWRDGSVYSTTGLEVAA